MRHPSTLTLVSLQYIKSRELCSGALGDAVTLARLVRGLETLPLCLLLSFIL